MNDLDAWVGREVTAEDQLGLAPAHGMVALLDRSANSLAAGSRLPPGWHWLYFWPITRESELGPDGHATRGSFLPPVGLPRRMWAGGRLRFLRSLELGQPVSRRSTIAAATRKDGRSGSLVFVTVKHVVSMNGAVAVEEEQDLVFRGAPDPGAPRAGGDPPPGDCQWRDTVRPDSVMLFRFSAVTFNGHRIHYDYPYVTGVEGYPNLVVHGPLLALLLLDAVGRWIPGAEITSFNYRALGPVFCDEVIGLAGRAVGSDGAEVFAVAPDGRAAMRAEVGYRRGA